MSKGFYFACILLMMLAASCGYQFGQGSITDNYKTICVPIVEGDRTGEFTNILIKQISHSGALTYARDGGDLILSVVIYECPEENIGFAYDTKNQHDNKKHNENEQNQENIETQNATKNKTDNEKNSSKKNNCPCEKLSHDIIPIETRATLAAEVTLMSSSGTTLLGPVRIYASVDFDHDYYFSPHHINVTSLGQLTDIYSARDAVKTPLFRALAEKITQYITQSW